MKLNAVPRILLVAAICAVALIGLVLGEGAARRGGQEILLPMEAVDPRSLLSGHYVQLGLSQRLTAPATCPAAGDYEWVALREEGGRFIAVGGAASREEAQLLGLPVKGTFTCSPPTPTTTESEAFPGWLTLHLGVERFHINQADALRIERVLRAQNADEATRAFAIVSVGRDGRARLKGLMIDGERLELSWL
ncbi:MAG: GDYXXLXY domain-containing protein [Vitreimonas sp.]